MTTVWLEYQITKAEGPPPPPMEGSLMSTSLPQERCCPVSSYFWETTLVSKWTVNEVYIKTVKKRKRKYCLFKNLINQKNWKIDISLLLEATIASFHIRREIPHLSRSHKEMMVTSTLPNTNNGQHFKRLAMYTTSQAFHRHYLISFSHQYK